MPQHLLELAFRITRGALCAFVCVAVLTGCRHDAPVVLTVSVAASLQGTIEEVEAAYCAGHPGVQFRNNFGSSGALALEIENGAPVDVFLSAAPGPMDTLATRGLLTSGSRTDVLRNTLVLIAPRESRLAGFNGLTESSVRLIAIGDPASVPAGQYGKRVLDALRLYERLKAKLVLGKDVRQVLTYVQTGNADAGLVYATDAASTNGVRVVAAAPASAGVAILYPAAVVAASPRQALATDIVRFFISAQSAAIFTRHGFTMASS